jgi:NAD(P)-dependent dehydrogenase (short-subunit alcohol dehydrogenase family)
MRLQDKVTIVTGAGAGIGRAIATVAAAQGAIVVVTDVFDGPPRPSPPRSAGQPPRMPWTSPTATRSPPWSPP